MKIQLPHNYIPRDYQVPFWAAMESGKRRAVCVWHRRAGKDKTFFNYVVQQMAERVGGYYYYFPTATLGRKALWDARDKDGFKVIEHIPKEFIKKKNDNEMKIETKNGSLFQILGADKLDVVGTNPVGVVMSEYSKQNPKAWDYIRPILAENKGWAIFNFTPRGKNHAYKLDRMARDNPKWFYQFLTVDETNAISAEAIQDEIDAGMSDEMVQQEFYCSYELGMQGAYYSRAISDAWKQGRITNLLHDEAAEVHTAWDLGVGDSTCIWWYQCIGNEIHVIDFHEASGEGMKYYVDLVKQKSRDNKYSYGKHFVPHDARQRLQAEEARTRVQIAAKLGLRLTVLKKSKIEDGIERVRSILSRCYFDKDRCERGIEALESYHRAKNEKMEVYMDKPCHDWSSHASDAFRYLAQSIGLTRAGGMTPERHRDLMNMVRRPA